MEQDPGWGQPFWPLLLCLWQLQDNGITVQLWVKNLNGTFSKFRLRKLSFKVVAESQKILCSGSAKAWSLTAFQDNLIRESKGCQSPRFQRNSAHEPNRWSCRSPADPNLPGFAKLRVRPSQLTVLTKCQTLPCTSPGWAFPSVRSSLKYTSALETWEQKGCWGHPIPASTTRKGSRPWMYSAKWLLSNHTSHLLSLFQQHPQTSGRGLHCACTTTSKYRARRQHSHKASLTPEQHSLPCPDKSPSSPKLGRSCSCFYQK